MAEPYTRQPAVPATSDAKRNHSTFVWLLQRHWFCVVALLPFAAMLAIHEVFEISDVVLGMQPGQREPAGWEILYNWAMIVVFFNGVGLFALLAIAAWTRGVKWVALKLGLLLIGWYLLLMWGENSPPQ